MNYSLFFIIFGLPVSSYLNHTICDYSIKETETLPALGRTAPIPSGSS